MIWRQVKQRMARVKLHIYIYSDVMKTIQCANAPILRITIMALWRYAGYGRPVAEFMHYIYIYIDN